MLESYESTVHVFEITETNLTQMFTKASALFAALMALGPTIASPLAPRSCSGETPYVFLSVHDWLKVDVLDKDPAVPSQQWGTYGSFLQGLNFSIADQYYTEHFIATAYVQNGEWNRDDPVNLVEEKKFDVSIWGCAVTNPSAVSPLRRESTSSIAASSSISTPTARSSIKPREMAKAGRSEPAARRFERRLIDVSVACISNDFMHAVLTRSKRLGAANSSLVIDPSLPDES